MKEWLEKQDRWLSRKAYLDNKNKEIIDGWRNNFNKANCRLMNFKTN